MTLRDEIEKAFDYRGDVTLHLVSGETVEGYLFNRDLDASPPRVEVYPKDADHARAIECAHISRIEFTGKDTAAGRTWEAWLEKVEQAKAEGKIAELYPEELEG